jgi:hypothetical protein
MAMVLAAPEMRGKSDKIVSYGNGGTKVSAGLAASIDASRNLVLYDGSFAFAGAAAYVEQNNRQSVILSALGVAVRVDADIADAITAGQPANIKKATGEFTNAQADGATIIATKAIFATAQVSAIDAAEEGGNTSIENAALIDFPNGL